MSPLSRRPLIYLITEGRLTVDNFESELKAVLAMIGHAAKAGIPLVQIREKGIPAKLLFELTKAAVQICRGSKTSVLVNGRGDVAVEANADGVHLPENGVPVGAVRRIIPNGFLIGVSCHDISSAMKAKTDGADFVTMSPVFDTPRKGTPVGLEMIADCVRQLDEFPVIALGGINEDNIDAVINTGAAGFAAIRMLNDESTLYRLGVRYCGELQNDSQL